MLLLQTYAVNSVLALLKALATMMSSDAEMIKRYPEINDEGRGEVHFACCLIAFGYAFEHIRIKERKMCEAFNQMLQELELSVANGKRLALELFAFMRENYGQDKLKQMAESSGGTVEGFLALGIANWVMLCMTKNRQHAEAQYGQMRIAKQLVAVAFDDKMEKLMGVIAGTKSSGIAEDDFMSFCKYKETLKCSESDSLHVDRMDYVNLIEKYCNCDVVLSNPYFILGLPSNVDDVGVKTRLAVLKDLRYDGDEIWSAQFKHLEGLRNVPTFEEVESLAASLRDDVDKSVYAYMGFWRLQDDVVFENAMNMIWSSGCESAYDLWWKLASENGGTRCVHSGGMHILRAGTFRGAAQLCIARHNFFVLNLLLAVAKERRIAGESQEFKKSVDRNWKFIESFSLERVDSPEWKDSLMIPIAYATRIPDDVWRMYVSIIKDVQLAEMLRPFLADLPGCVRLWQARRYCCQEEFERARELFDASNPQWLLQPLERYSEVLHRISASEICACNSIVAQEGGRGRECADRVFDASVDSLRVAVGLLGGENVEEYFEERYHALHNTYAPKGEKWFDQFFIAVRRKVLSIRAKLCDEVARACISYIDTYVGNGGSVYFCDSWRDCFKNIVVDKSIVR